MWYSPSSEVLSAGQQIPCVLGIPKIHCLLYIYIFINNYKYALHVSVYNAPDDGRKGHPKHVEHTCSC